MGFQNDMPFLPEKEAFADDWAETVNKVVPAVVVLQTTTCRAFDTELPSSGSATGFVVDKQRGIILTNRHVVNPGMLFNYFYFCCCCKL
jgi:S1-C subfamily serine protease